MPAPIDPSTVLNLLLGIGEADPENDWYLTALVPTGDDPGHKRPDPAALAHLSDEDELVGLYGWGLYQDAACIAVYTSDNRLHQNGAATPIGLSNSIWEAIALSIEAIAEVLPPGSGTMPT